MSTVCVVIEYWNNGEDYSEDFKENSIVLAVAGNPTIAEDIIINRRNDTMKVYVNNGYIVGEAAGLEDYFESLQIKEPNRETVDNYYWKFIDFEIIDN